jgi:hypothetical protein
MLTRRSPSTRMPPRPSSPLGRGPRTGTPNGSSSTTATTAPTTPRRPRRARQRASNSSARADWTASANAPHAKAGSQPARPRARGCALGPGQPIELVGPDSRTMVSDGEVLPSAIAGALDSGGGGEQSRSARCGSVSVGTAAETTREGRGSRDPHRLLARRVVDRRSRIARTCPSRVSPAAQPCPCPHQVCGRGTASCDARTSTRRAASRRCARSAPTTWSSSHAEHGALVHGCTPVR